MHVHTLNIMVTQFNFTSSYVFELSKGIQVTLKCFQICKNFKLKRDYQIRFKWARIILRFLCLKCCFIVNLYLFKTNFNHNNFSLPCFKHFYDLFPPKDFKRSPSIIFFMINLVLCFFNPKGSWKASSKSLVEFMPLYLLFETGNLRFFWCTFNALFTFRNKIIN